MALDMKSIKVEYKRKIEQRKMGEKLFVLEVIRDLDEAIDTICEAMTDEERKDEIAILIRAIQISNKFGPLILKDADNSGGTAATSAAILMSSYCAAMGMTLHDTMELLMSVHKQTMAMEREL